MQKTLWQCAALGAVTALVLAGSAGAQLTQSSTGTAHAAAAANADWPMYGNTSDNTHYSPLTQITPANVSTLGVAWQQQEGQNISIFENMPVVVNGVMYYTTNTDQVRAVDGATGKLLWQYTPKVNFYTGLAGGGGGIQVNRGVAVANGRVFLATADAQMIALQAATGEVLWDTYIAPPSAGYSESSGPTYYNGMLFIGAALGDSGQRGFVEALDANTGKQLWRFYTVPKPGQGWNQPASAHHGGGDVWMPITVDTTTGIVYAGTGNPSPDFDNSQRPGCDPWADAIVALNAKTGKFIWAHSEVCNDVWDYDSMPSPFLMNIPINGVVTRVVGHTNKSGFITFYNAATGKVISVTPHLSVYNMPHPKPSPAGAKVCTGTQGGTEFEPASYDPVTQLVYQSYANGCFIFKLAPSAQTNGHQFNQFDLGGSTTLIPGTVSGGIGAINPVTGKVVWKTPFKLPSYSGALSTASGLVFVGDDDGNFRALDATNGKVLWTANLGLAFGAPPIAYEINGTEYIAIAVGGSDNSSLYDTAPFGGTMVVFKLGGKPATKLPIVNGTTGTTKLPPLTGFTQINKYMWALPSKKIVVIQVLAAATGANNGFNFDGYYNGQATLTVPQFWSAFIEFKNLAALPHSAAVTLGNKAPATVLGGALGPVETPNATQGTTGNLWQIIGGGGFPAVLDTAGHYYLSCLVPGHLASGMWDNFVVSTTATMPSISAPGM
jgi:PQQ-dependent dehydrogenase (methanol/ethanol family)